MTNTEIRHLRPISPRLFVSSCLASWTPSARAEHFGVFHAVNEGETTWYRFALAIMEGAARRGAARVAVQPIKTEDYPTKARRPAYSMLSTEKLHAVHGIRLRHWEAALSDCLDQLIGPAHNRRLAEFDKSSGDIE